MNHAIEAIKGEASEIEKEAAFWAVAHRLHGRKWEKRNLQIGLPAALLAATAGGVIFGSLPKENIIPGSVAMAVAVLTAMTAFLSPAERSTSHRASSARFAEIRRRANLLRDLHCVLADDSDREGIDELVSTIEELTKMLSEAEQSAPPLSETTRKRAKSELAEGLPEVV